MPENQPSRWMIFQRWIWRSKVWWTAVEVQAVATVLIRGRWMRLIWRSWRRTPCCLPRICNCTYHQQTDMKTHNTRSTKPTWDCLQKSWNSQRRFSSRPIPGVFLSRLRPGLVSSTASQYIEYYIIYLTWKSCNWYYLLLAFNVQASLIDWSAALKHTDRPTDRHPTKSSVHLAEIKIDLVILSYIGNDGDHVVGKESHVACHEYTTKLQQH